ncbi:hypothetical protein G210_3803 [Candida maltosa Xu316]|uniref:Uncharacterized protein n=1 Tax=Candida maltosa (strain Xu316) TaxID=1245528 RepID=M3HFD7_CANMX|nr:hypothetical protein G210_3803 [Candida maltosa Xu316]
MYKEENDAQTKGIQELRFLLARKKKNVCKHIILSIWVERVANR